MRKIISKSFELEYNEPKKNRLDAYLNGELDDLTRSQIQKLIKDQNILVNGQPVSKSGYKITANDKITVNIPEEEPIKAVPENIPIEVVYEDQDVIVVNKPQGW